MDPARIATANATECATLFDEWVTLGVRHVVVSPGSRSTPLALAAADAADAGLLELSVHIDERSAGFVALGIGAATGLPAILVCTSGTAAANFAPAVIEAGLSAVPMIVATADRPPELRDRGAPQTIDQVELYGNAAVEFVDVAPPDQTAPELWRPLARDAFVRSGAGPVHLNLCFREPLVGQASALPARIADPVPPRQRAVVPEIEPVPEALARAGRGLIVAGGRALVEPDRIAALAERWGWPILADPLGGLRSHAHAVTAFDPMLRSPHFAKRMRPDVVIRFGRPPASRAANEWIRDSNCPVVQVGGPGRVDPDHRVTAYCDVGSLDEAVVSGAADGWLVGWQEANRAAEAAIVEHLPDTITEPGVARVVAEATAGSRQLMVSSSMPVRDVESYGGSWADAFANRGANGIDGVVSTGVGWALTAVPTTVLIGDLAFCHDSNAMLGLVDRPADITIVVIDNDGGGIFSFLPQAGALPPQRFEMLFGTPSGVDIPTLARAHGIDVVEVETLTELAAQLSADVGGTRVLRVCTDRVANVTVHADLNGAVAAALAAL